ncbi:hypothetical protein, partial [Sphingomonas sp. CCH9-H8]|uniref:hypothetical protein n=1 Tax=Sphingomonas sp. CCH9-H8 TaxID=1768772 RepID=UPI000A8151B5
MRHFMTALTALALTTTAAPALAQTRAAPADAVKLDTKRIDAMLAKMIADGRAVGGSVLVW